MVKRSTRSSKRRVGAAAESSDIEVNDNKKDTTMKSMMALLMMSIKIVLTMVPKD